MRLTRKAFREWLESKQPAEGVGYAVSAEECPIANFHRDLHPDSRVEVYLDYIKVNGKRRPHTEWSKAFVEKVDRYGYRVVVTARMALDLLGES
jgi:hypothetical protein